VNPFVKRTRTCGAMIGLRLSHLYWGETAVLPVVQGLQEGTSPVFGTLGPLLTELGKSALPWLSQVWKWATKFHHLRSAWIWSTTP